MSAPHQNGVDERLLGPSSPFLDHDQDTGDDAEADGACVASTADLIMQSVQVRRRSLFIIICKIKKFIIHCGNIFSDNFHRFSKEDTSQNISFINIKHF